MPRDLYMRRFIFMFAIIAFDQLVKIIIRSTMTVGQSISVIGDFFTLTYIKNSGAAFSMLSGQRILLIVVPLIAIIGCTIYIVKNEYISKVLSAALLMIIAGGAGNLIDRILFGPVTDMFKLSVFPPVFNIADISVTFGCILLIVYVLFEEKLKDKK